MDWAPWIPIPMKQMNHYWCNIITTWNRFMHQNGEVCCKKMSKRRMTDGGRRTYASYYLVSHSHTGLEQVCSAMHHRPSTPLLRNIICRVQKGGIIDQLQVSWHFESQIKSVADPPFGSKLLQQEILMDPYICWGGQNQCLCWDFAVQSRFIVHCDWHFSLFLFSPMKDAPFLCGWGSTGGNVR
jgi:hypothetical protein